jgi:predicted transcriptional regulator
MSGRTLMITMTDDWRSSLRSAGRHATGRTYQGEVLNFETAGSFFGKLTERRWAMVHALQGQGPMPVREVARRVGRDVRRVHDDIQVLTELGLVERTEDGGVECPFETVHIDMRLTGMQPLAA